MTRKKFLKSFDVYGVEYRAYRGTPDNEDHDGECCYQTKEIMINKTMEKEKEDVTLFHELCHAHMYENGLYFILSEDNQELICIMAEKLFKISQKLITKEG